MDGQFRKLGTHAPVVGPPPNPAGPVATPAAAGPSRSFTQFDANVIMILAAFLCAMICALAVNTIVRCCLRFTNRVWVGPEPAGTLDQPAPVRVSRKEALKALPTLVYSTGLGLPLSGSDCAICLSEFAPGERVRVLPKCNHGFHVRCIDRWLASRSSCPMCRQCLFGSCQVIFGCREVALTGSTQSAPVQMNPMDPEGFLVEYRVES
ncbi:RING-H2 finger protein ATL78 [Elaeis guineensis]|uniref:RING-H2 finger protein ATL78 n=1 Tax=Elaeis guineensis var. tenera TaxID=51953 RepID=A0A6I9QN04_ELAGV|nr:RING-H2 finger protein ATL78 [Elaeis guineensis]